MVTAKHLATPLKQKLISTYTFVAKQSWKVLVPAGIAAVLLASTGGWLIHTQIRQHNEAVQQAANAQQEQLQAQNLAKQNGVASDPKSNSATSNSISNANGGLAPYDPRSAGSLQPSPDKPPIPKTQKPLVISPASITIYKNQTVAQGVKAGIDAGIVTVSTGDGRALYYPTSTGSLLLTATAFNPRASWAMTVSSSYASIGSTNVPISAVAVDGSASYVGTLHVTTLPLPAFSVTSSRLNGHGVIYNVLAFDGLNYSDTFSGAYLPSVSVQGDMNCSSVTFNSYTITCNTNTSGLASGDHLFSFVFENQFQRIVVPAEMYIV